MENNLGFFSIYGHNFKLCDVSYVGPFAVGGFSFIVGGQELEAVGDKAEAIRGSLLTALSITETMEPKPSQFSESVIYETPSNPS